MQVLHLNTYSEGGSYEYAAVLSEALTLRGISSVVRCKPSIHGRPAVALLNRTSRKVDVSLSRGTWHRSCRFLPAPSKEELRGVDIVHLHTVGDWFDVAEWLSTLPPRVALVVSLHDLWHVSGGCFVYEGCDGFLTSCSPCPILRTPLASWLSRRELSWKASLYKKRNTMLVANSHWLASLVEHGTVAKEMGVTVIPPAVNTEVFRPLDKSVCRERLGLPSNKFIIATGCASLTDVYKNTQWLLDVFAKLPDTDDVVILAFGDGTLTVPSGLNVHFLGPIKDRAWLATVYSAADMFVSASRLETYGLTLVESIACGTPVVAFRTGGIPEAAADGKASILCDVLDERSILEAITRLRTSESLRASLSATGVEIVRARNAPSVFAGSFDTLYRQCLSSR